MIWNFSVPMSFWKLTGYCFFPETGDSYDLYLCDMVICLGLEAPIGLELYIRSGLWYEWLCVSWKSSETERAGLGPFC